jgi:putative ABC transport system permease protein
MPRPPLPSPLLERLVARWLGAAASTPFLIGDLREEHAGLRRRWPAWLCTLWYLSQGLRLGARLRWEKARTRIAPAPRSSPPRAFGDLVSTELRQAARFLRRRPAFTGTLVFTVALAIATTTVSFAVLDGVLLEPLPYESPSRLVAVWETNPRGNQRNVASPANFLTWRDELESFDRTAALVEASTTLREGEDPERVGLVEASAQYFDAVGARPLAGRLYDESEDAPDAESVVVLSESFWRRRFAADPEVVGRTLQLGSGSYTVVGVLPDRYDLDLGISFGGVGSRDVWIPPGFGADAREFSGRYLTVVARLAPGVSLADAREEASSLAAALEQQFPDRQRGWGVNLVPLQEDLVGDASSMVLIVFGAVCFVLLIACANVANLLMTRAAERHQEMAVRSAMGAGWSRLLQQLLLESALLSALGGALGIVLAAWGVRALVRSAPDLPRIDEVTLDASVLAFALIATIGTALLFGLAPTLPLSGGRLSGWLRDRGAGARRETRRARGLLAVAQTALSLVLLVGAGLLGRSLLNRLEVGVGFDVERLVSAEIQLGSSYETPAQRSDFFERMVERVRAIPGVSDASAITWAPLAGGGTRTSFWALERPVPEAGQQPGADVRWVHRDYHRAMGIPVFAGRAFEPRDDAEAPTVVLVNETGAEAVWPGEDAIGKRIAMPWNDTILAEVVGVVGDVRHGGPDTEPYPMFYFDHRQFSAFQQMSLVIRTADGTTAADVLPGVRAALREMDRGLPLYNVRTMESLFSDAITRARFATTSMGIFALLALLLAAIGIYGVMAHATEQRVREIGIRMALGAGRRSILGMVVRQGMAHVLIAILIGSAGALALARFLQGLVFDVSTTDPLTFVAMALVLGATGLLACWLPARRASGIDPAETIRSE